MHLCVSTITLRRDFNGILKCIKMDICHLGPGKKKAFVGKGITPLQVMASFSNFPVYKK